MRRPSLNPFGQGDPSVDGILGGAYKTVKYVADNLAVIKKVADWIMNGGTVPEVPGNGGGNGGGDGSGGTGGVALPNMAGNKGGVLTVNEAETAAVWRQPSTGAFFPEAPLDGKLYGRTDAAWAEIVLNAGGRGISNTVVNGEGHLVVTYSDGEVFDAGLVAGKDGEDGKDGDPGFGAIVNFADYKAMPAGGSGVYMIIPVADGEPGVALTQSASVILPKDTPNAGAGIWINAQQNGYKITLGLTNAPEPQPGGGNEDIDLSGSGAVYGAPGSIFPLGIFLANTTKTLNVTLPNGLPMLIERRNPGSVPVTASWRLSNVGAPYPREGDAVGAAIVMNKLGSAGGFSMRNGNVLMQYGSYLSTPSMGLETTITSNEQTTQTPNMIRIGFKGVAPPEAEFGGVLAGLMDYGVGEFRLEAYWQGKTMKLMIGRNGGTENVVSDPDDRRVLGTNQHYEVEWVNNPNGPGGTATFFIDGIQSGAAKTTEFKPRITPRMPFEVNASEGNPSVGLNNLEIERSTLSFGKVVTDITYDPVASGPISRVDLESLVVDARTVTNPGPYMLEYTAGTDERFELEINVGTMQIPAGRAYKAVLEDWSTGVGVKHPNELIMTKVAAQNCRFQDQDLYGSQASWTEVLPQGPVPNINGINYYCEGIRMGNYVQFQFIYDWDATQMPANPFGDPTNKNSYMVPHKWLIYDVNNTLIARVEQLNGEPMNSASRPATWQGSIDGRGVGIFTANNQWFPHGTVRSSIIWRSHDPVAYDQARIHSTLPVYDIRVPFASFMGYSVNGGDARMYGGGQINGFANYRAMPWLPMSTAEIVEAGRTTTSPYKRLFNETAIAPNAGLWLKYSPFYSHGRSPITGPGGTRDDRQIIPEPVAVYMRDRTARRLFDNLELSKITLDYLTGYASDAVHGMEKGRATPLYKNQPRRNIRLRNHYYGPGEASTPAEQAWYVQGGRTYEWMQGNNPLRIKVPYHGIDPAKPIFGTHMIDKAHAHQFPHWGSLLYQTPEFAFLGHKFSDQCRMYTNYIIGDDGDPNHNGNREGAWAFMHAALLWKTGSSNSSRLYSQDEILDWVVFDFELFYDVHYASEPGFLNPPVNVMTGNQVDMNKVAYASSSRFGVSTSYGGNTYTHDFMVGYWLSALHAGHKLGFNQAVSAASAKAKAVMDWLYTIHAKRITGRLLHALQVDCMEGTEYLFPLWTEAQIKAAGGVVSNLPQNFEQLVAALPANKKTARWDICTDQYGNIQSRDGQSMDQLLAGPGLLMDMGMSGAALTDAYNKAEQLFQEKLQQELAEGEMAGAGWFQFHQATNNRPYKP